MTFDNLKLDADDLEDLTMAKGLLENPGFAASLTNLVGKPVEGALCLLPDGRNNRLAKTIGFSLEKFYHTGLLGMKGTSPGKYSNGLYKGVVFISGGIGGWGGFSTLMFELPFSITVMLRSIADIARCEGENIHSPETRLECLKIFAFGDESHSDDASQSGYYAVRYALAELSPLITRRVISKIAEQFSIRVSQKAMAQITPGISAFAGSGINILFISHFQNIA